MKKINKGLSIVLVTIAILLMYNSCSKYLDIQSNDALVIPKSLEDLQKLLDNTLKMNRGIGSMGEISADDYFLEQSVLATVTDIDRLNYTWRNNLYNFSNDWSAGYVPVYSCNLVLERLAKIERTAVNASDYDRIKGTAFFARSNQYLSLLWNYAKAFQSTTAASDLGIVLRNSSDMNEKSKRSSVLECYNALIKDLHDAAEFLPQTSSHVMRPSKAAAYGLLARAYLSMAKYDSAYYYADKMLQINDDLMDFNNPDEVDLTGINPFLRYNKEIVVYYEQTSNGTPLIRIAQMDTVLYTSFDANDLRKEAYFKSGVNGYKAFKGNYAVASNAWETVSPFGGIAIDEMYLIRAECLARAGKLAEAQKDLNMLLAKRYKTGTFVPYKLTIAKDVLELILKERRKELLFRGLRWIDIKRLNLEGANIVQKRFLDGKEYILHPNANRYALPLPDDIIRVTGIEQNPR
ncbi:MULTISPECIES: RagB/SusD family nutrient uptake outer membrane protein [Sphingobacterium]|uniref:RagB/SusD family nutrient uptake outer membrane protein n=1 Tax=Sphingobacterium TaxID=28453 RepID=UPI00257C2E51|nr:MULTISPECIES: RagB/SusD family nutrient uptake outer membrane protein [Sphingobacterium]